MKYWEIIADKVERGGLVVGNYNPQSTRTPLVQSGFGGFFSGLPFFAESTFNAPPPMTRLKQILRWVAVLPAALLAFIAVMFLIDWMAPWAYWMALWALGNPT